MANITYNPEKFQLTIARYKKGGHVFEVVVDPDLALSLRGGADVEMSDVLQADDVFADAQKGKLASSQTFSEIFNTEDSIQIAHTIICDGELHLTAEYRRDLREKKRKQIISMIHMNGIDPRSGLVHPLNRIESALDECKAKIDEFASIEEQVESILPKLREILPIKFERRKLNIHIHATYAAKAYGTLRGVVSSSWESDGSLRAVVDIPGGLEEEFTNALQKLTQGTAEVTRVEK